jgi:hypothetical protein
MKVVYNWNLIDFNNNKSEIKTIYNKISTLNSYPAANQWQYLFPIIDKYFDSEKTSFAILYREDEPFFIMPVSVFLVKKFVFNWCEIGYPYHTHINLIKLPDEIINNSIIIEKLIHDIKEKYGNKWSRFSIRNVETGECCYEYSGDVSFFRTDKKRVISEILSKKHIRNFKRINKKFNNSIGEIDFTINSKPLSISLKDFIDTEDDSWKGISGISINSSPKLLSTYQEFCDNFSDEKMFLAKIKSNEIILSTVLGFNLDGIIYIHKISHNTKYSEYSPGSILILKILEHCIKSEDINILNLVTSPEWSKRWHPEKKQVSNITYYNNNSSGLLLNIVIMYWRKCKPFLKYILRYKK